jgi:hypothetical protein
VLACAAVESGFVIDLNAVPHVVILGGMALICLCVPISLYLLFTMDQRKATREIQRGAAVRGWRCRSRSGGFRIEGSTGAGSTLNGLAWVMTSGNSREGEMRWSSELDLRFPALGGETDVAILPRDGRPLPTTALSPGVDARIAKFSNTLAGVTQFLRDSDEVRSGIAAFDAAYEVMARQTARPLVDAALARRIVFWPPDAVVPYSIVAWRDPFGFNFNARLPGPPNWATVAWLASVGGDFAGRLPAAVTAPRPSGCFDRIIGRISRL